MLLAASVPVSWSAIAPEIVLLSCACALLVFGIFLPERLAHPVAAGVAVGGLVGAMVAPIAQWDDASRTAFQDTLRIDAFGNAGRLLIFAAGILAVLVAWGMPRRGACDRVPRAAADGLRRHVAAGRGQQPDDPVHRAGAVLDRALRAGRDRRRRAARPGGRPQVPGDRVGGRRLPAVRVGARVRRHRLAPVRPDRAEHRRRPRRRAADGDRADRGRARLQGQRRALPHVDAGRLRGSADAGDRVHVGRHQGDRAGGDDADPGRRLRRGLADLAGRDRRDRHRLVRGRQPGARCASRT